MEKGKSQAPTPPSGLGLSPGLWQAFGCTASCSAPKGEFQLSTAGCLEGKGLAGNVQRQQSCLNANTGSRVGETGRGSQPSPSAVNMAAASLSWACALGEMSKLDGEGHCSLTWNGV